MVKKSKRLKRLEKAYGGLPSAVEVHSLGTRYKIA